MQLYVINECFIVRAAPSNKFDSGGKMLHLVFVSLLIVILANVIAISVVSATVTRFKRLTLRRVMQGRAWRSPVD
jgi:hypothetical protein